MSLITANLKVADPCTYRIIAKSTTVLLDEGDAAKARAFGSLFELIQTYQRLDDCLLQVGFHKASSLLLAALAGACVLLWNVGGRRPQVGKVSF